MAASATSRPHSSHSSQTLLLCLVRAPVQGVTWGCGAWKLSLQHCLSSARTQRLTEKKSCWFAPTITAHRFPQVVSYSHTPGIVFADSSFPSFPFVALPCCHPLAFCKEVTNPFVTTVAPFPSFFPLTL